MFDVGKHIGQEGSDIGTIIFTLVSCVVVDQLELLQNSCIPKHIQSIRQMICAASYTHL